METSLFGYGITTKALAKEFAKPIFYDDKCHKPFFDEDGFEVRPSWMFEAKYSSLQIPSPGIPPSHKLIQKANNLVSEYDYFAHAMPSSVWVSGTNGKTTTTQMITHLLHDKGALSGGNIGAPLANLDKSALLWILETSSFMLHYTNRAKPNIYILLPIAPDHLSWHGSFESYEEAKLKPLKLMQEGDVALVPKKYANTPSNAFVIGYETSKDLANFFGIDSTKVNFQAAFLLDALLALAVEKILFDRISYEKINSFRLEAHRQEEFFDNKGRLWVNDSKATNIDATIAALKRYKDKKLHLILGGDDKGVDLAELFCYLQSLEVTTYHIGSNSERLNSLAREFGIDFVFAKSLDRAVMEIKKVLQQDEVALLSPAAASLDQFSSYKERGELFKKYAIS